MGKKKPKRKKKKQKKSEEPEEVAVDDEYEAEIKEDRLKEKKRDRNFFVAVGIVVAVVIILVVIGVQVRNYNINKNTYNNFNFEQRGGFWYTSIEQEGMLTFIPFHYHPRELEDFVSEPLIENKMLTLNGSVYITLDPELNSTAVQAAVQVARITGTRYGILNLPTQAAFARQIDEGMGVNATYPVITCDDADNETLVVLLKVGSINALYSVDNCIVIEAVDEQELVRGAEKLDYLLLKIMRA